MALNPSPKFIPFTLKGISGGSARSSGDSSAATAPFQIKHLDIHRHIKEKLDYFYKANKIPHIIFHGSSGSGKFTLVYDFIQKIYDHDKQKIKTNVMIVNCSHGKGIKFIREELKFFAKTNIQNNAGVKFKTILLLNAHHLTIDAQSALRRCIELFSYNTRFFIIVENKNKLLNPILSRFSDIYVPEYIPVPASENTSVSAGSTLEPSNKIMNLHQYVIREKMSENIMDMCDQVKMYMADILEKSNPHDPKKLAEITEKMYNSGISALDIVEYLGHQLQTSTSTVSSSKIANIIMDFNNVKIEFKCEKLLIFWLITQIL